MTADPDITSPAGTPSEATFLAPPTAETPTLPGRSDGNRRVEAQTSGTTPMLRKHRIRRAALAGTVALALLSSGAGVAGLVALRESNLPAAPAGPALGFAQVSRTTLVREERVDGVLGYPPSDPVMAQVAGTVTQLRQPGEVVGFGERLFDIDDHAVTLMRGVLPAWRDFGPGMADGRDIRQLEQGLVDAGMATRAGSSRGDETPRGRAETSVVKVDDHFDETTEAAVRRFQRSRAIPQDGVLGLGEVAFRPEPIRVGSVSIRLGSSLSPGSMVYETTTAVSTVTASLGLDNRGLLGEGDAVEVEMPDGSDVAGVVESVSTVPGTEAGAAAISVRIALEAAGDLAEATVDIRVTRDRRENVLAVPVTALVALAEGGFAVEVERDGLRQLIAVIPGLSAGGLVEVEGAIREGDSVLVPQ